jgi:ATP-dependent DNA helicase DinG
LLANKQAAVKYEKRLKEIQWALARISDSLGRFSRHGDLVYWLEETKITAADEPDFRLNLLSGIPKDLGELLRRDLWSRELPIVLTSGTMSAAGSFEHIKRKLGLDLLPLKRLTETAKPSPFNHRENALLYISENTPFPDNRDEDYISAIADEAERLIAASHGHAALLFTSYKAMDMVWERISARRLPYPLFRLNRGGGAVIERFKNSGNGVLFASGALWEGIDIPGDILSLLVIVRLPFAVPDPVSEWERTLYDEMSEYKSKVVVPEMLIKLKQGFGRLIRTESDTGVVAILDSRANMRGAYRSRVLAALPPCGVTSSVADVERFIHEKKSAPYFGEI